MLILVQRKNEKDQVHIFLGTCCKNFQIHLQKIMYLFQHTKYGVRLDFLFRSFIFAIFTLL